MKNDNTEYKIFIQNTEARIKKPFFTGYKPSFWFKTKHDKIKLPEKE
jgi:hypothetical protein